MKRLLRLLLVLSILVSSPPDGSAQSTASALFTEAGNAFRRGDTAGAAKLLENAIEAAAREPNPQVEGDARRALGTYLARTAQFEASDKHLKAALALFERAGDLSKAASVRTFLGSTAFEKGNREEAARYYQEAMTAYVALNDRAAVAQLHYSLTFFSKTSEELMDHIRSGLQLAREIGDRRVEASLLHAWADSSYGSDSFDGAFDRLKQARAIFEDVGDRASLARVLTSLGRLYRVHGHPDQAIPFYRQARELQMQTGDKSGVIQSLDGIGVALNILGRHSDAMVTYQEALGLAKETGSQLLIAFIFNGVAATHIYLKQYQSAADLLEQSRLMPNYSISVLQLLSVARLGLGQYEAALAAANDGLKRSDSEELLRNLHSSKARALRKLGKTSEALTEIRMVTDSIEKARRTLIPTDFMKQGFSDTDRELTMIAIDVLLDGNQPHEALATAEQARGRAFLDLLATKALRVDSSAAIPPVRSPGGRRDLPSSVSAIPASDGDLVALAGRLGATVLAYWVGPDSTIIWTVSPGGQVTAVRTDSGANDLGNWIDEAIRPAQPPSNRKSQIVALASRAGETVLTGGGNRVAWQRLYNALIRPVRSNLPAKGTRRLLIIPSGPLFRLSFAALMDERGRYLIEDYSLQYAPNAAVLNHTLQIKLETEKVAGRYVFVSNPSGMPASDNGKPLPALPGSDVEVRRVSQSFASAATSTLRGATANETSVRRAIESAKIIHFATHGIINDDDPLASYLALGRDADASADGRLSAEEIYGLKLNASLVVLSACRTGLGQISGDGVSGLARAFFYAGAASVVATLWDVADEPAAQLVAEFYRSLGPALQNNKSEALRTAQLRLLRALRKGELRVNTPFGRLPLPEDPVLWAGFVLIGEP